MSVFLLAAIANAGLGMLQLVIAVIIAGVLLPQAENGARAANAVATRLAGERGPSLVTLAGATIRSVARGVLGTAMIQALLAGVGLVVAGVPAAGLLAFVCLILCTVQIGPGLVLVPAIIYLFWNAETTTAIPSTAWSIPVMLIDNVLKPLLMRSSVDVPTVIILIGVIGGLLAYGLIGVFLGPVIIALGYELFRAWVRGEETVLRRTHGMYTGLSCSLYNLTLLAGGQKEIADCDHDRTPSLGWRADQLGQRPLDSPCPP